jgi:hypothetical protein
VPELETDEVPIARVDLAQAELGFLGDDSRRLVVLEPQPGDVGLSGSLSDEPST